MTQFFSQRINILGQWWWLEFSEQVFDDAGEPVDGYILPDRLLIKITKSKNIERIREVILHELVHAVDGIFSLNLSEKQVDKLARGLFGVIRQDDLNSMIFGQP